jgi:hypothetical protein
MVLDLNDRRDVLARRSAMWMAVVALAATGAVGTGAQAEAKPRKFQNCAALNQVYRHGVGEPDARDKVRPGNVPVTTFTRNTAVYNANRARLDRDRDGIACEKR